MQMLDIMRRLNSEFEVTFLLSAYAETLQRHDRGRGLPRGVTVVPVAGVEDVRERFEALLDVELNGDAAHAGARVPATAIVREAAEVFGVALARLQTLEAGTRPAPAPAAELVF